MERSQHFSNFANDNNSVLERMLSTPPTEAPIPPETIRPPPAHSGPAQRPPFFQFNDNRGAFHPVDFSNIHPVSNS